MLQLRTKGHFFNSTRNACKTYQSNVCQADDVSEYWSLPFMGLQLSFPLRSICPLSTVGWDNIVVPIVSFSLSWELFITWAALKAWSLTWLNQENMPMCQSTIRIGCYRTGPPLPSSMASLLSPFPLSPSLPMKRYRGIFAS